jgi:hypothetical protein
VPRSRPFRVVRLDANGNEFTIRATSSRCEADGLVREFEARGHKQTYWIERSTDDESR